MPSAISVSIDRQFNGPPKSGNGGYVAGMTADLLLGEGSGNAAFEVSLKAPPPLDTPLDAVTDETGKLTLMEGDKPVVDGRLLNDWTLDLPPFSARAALSTSVFESTLGFDECFVCGSNRKKGDGLCLRAEQQPDPSDHWIAPFDVDPAFCGTDGVLARRYMVSALDCPGYAAVAAGELAVLARFRFRISGRLTAGDQAEVHAWPIQSSGRKRVAGTAILDPTGGVVGYAEALWIVIRPDQLRQAS